MEEGLTAEVSTPGEEDSQDKQGEAGKPGSD